MAEAARRTTARSGPSTTAVEAVCDFTHGAAVPEDVLTHARSALLDALAVTAAGGREPSVERLAASLAVPSPEAAVPSLWSAAGHVEEDAALLLGMASHILDYDDVAMLAICHPTVPVLAALLAGADRSATSGRALLEALAIGQEVSIRIGEAMGFRHYGLGFHATSTLGTIGATAALARLRRLGPGETRNALAIAASLACGVRANFGSDVKSLHVGFAAANAVRAARLAAAGLVGAAEPFEGPSGYLHALSGGEISAWPAAVALGRPFAIVEPGFEQKRYPCCYLLHRMIEGTLALRGQTGFDLGTVAAVRVVTARGGTSALIHPFPRNGLNALFSAPYAVCAALADGRVDLASFTDEAVLRPHVQRRLRDVDVVERDDASEDVATAPVDVTLVSADGRSVSTTVRVSPGSLADPLTPDQARAKWTDCLARGSRGALSSERADALYREAESVAGMTAIDGWLGGLAAALSGRPA